MTHETFRHESCRGDATTTPFITKAGTILRYLLVGLLLISPTLPVISQEAFDFDDVEGEEIESSRLGAAGPLPFPAINIYADFALEAKMAMDFSEVSSASFSQIHHALLLSAESGGIYSAMVDVLNYQDLYELGIKLDALQLRMGRIFVPIGESNYHHIYGGKTDLAGLFLPTFYTDYGIAAQFTPGEISQIDVFIGNGFPSNISGPIFSQSSSDQNLFKSIALRYRMEPTNRVYWSISGMWDVYSQNNELSESILIGGADAGYSAPKWHAKAGFLAMQIMLPSDTSYMRLGTYAELGLHLSPVLTLRMRGGTIDTNSTLENSGDVANANVGLIYKVGALELEASYLLNQNINNLFDPTDPQNYHSVLAKILFTL